MVGDTGAVPGCRESDGQVHPGVILLPYSNQNTIIHCLGPYLFIISVTIIVDDGTEEFVPFEHGEELEGRLLGQVVRGLDGLTPGHDVVHFDAEPEIRHLPPTGARKVISALRKRIEMEGIGLTCRQAA